MTFANETEEHAQQTRWREWQAAYARASRRNAAQATIVAIAALSLVAAFLLMQFVASSRVV